MGNSIQKIAFLFLLVFIISCSKNDSGGTGSQNIVLNGCDSIKKNLITLNYKDSIRLSACFVLSRKDSLYLFPSSFVNTINTIAGNGTRSSTGDGGMAINSTLREPRYLLLDRRNGDILVQDQGMGGIRKISTNGLINSAVNITNVGAWGGFTLDSAGNYYFTVTDFANGSVIKKLSTTGVLTTIAGTKERGPLGDGGLAVNAGLNNPSSIIIDKFNNIIFIDNGSGRIRKINTSGIITTLSIINYPMDMCYNSITDELYVISDASQSTIFKISSDGTKTKIAGGGVNNFENGAKAIDVKISSNFICLDNDENIYFSEVQNNRIFKIFKSGIIYLIGGNSTSGFSGDGGNALNASINYPTGILIDKDGNLVFSDMTNNRIRKITLAK